MPATFSQRYDPAANLLRADWAGTVDEASLQAQYAGLLAATRAHGNCRFWLLDISRRTWHPAGFGQWFAGSYAPQLHAALGGPVFIAYVLGTTQQALADSPSAQAMECGCAAHDVYPFFFSNEADALAWLAHQQRLDVAGGPRAVASAPASF